MEQPYKTLSCQGYGQIHCRFMFVGISAGKLGALQTNVPFTKDSSGRLLQRVLGELLLSNSDEFSLKPELVNCWITNLVKGRILDEKGNNRLPNKKEIEWWKPYFADEYNYVKPFRVVALGKLVYEELLGDVVTHMSFLNHPRWYASHGAINKDTKAWKQMASDYKKVLKK